MLPNRNQYITETMTNSESFQVDIAIDAIKSNLYTVEKLSNDEFNINPSHGSLNVYVELNIEEKEVDASFSHAFGTQHEVEIEKTYSVKDITVFDQDGSEVSINYSQSEQLTELVNSIVKQYTPE